MSPLLRITLTLILVLALAVTGMVMPDRQAILASATGAVLVLLFPIWMVGNKMIKQGLQGAKNPARIDREAKQLIDIISKAFNEDGRDQIGSAAQKTIVSTMRNIKSGKIKNAGAAAKGLSAIRARQFKTARNPSEISATLARYYLLAGDKTADGERARTHQQFHRRYQGFDLGFEGLVAWCSMRNASLHVSAEKSDAFCAPEAGQLSWR